MKTFFYILLLLVLPLAAQAQDITQTLKGTIYDQNTRTPNRGYRSGAKLRPYYRGNY